MWLGSVTRVTIENFKAHGRTNIELEPLTVLVGANGVGKTSLLEALQILSRSILIRMSEILRGSLHPLYLLRDRERDAQLAAVFKCDDGDEYSLSLKFARGIHSNGTTEPGGVQFNEDEAAHHKLPTHPLVREAAYGVLLRLDACAIARTGYVESGGPRVNPDGSNVAAVLASWKLDDEWRFGATEEALRAIVPQVKKVRVRSVPPEGEERANGYTLAIDFNDAPDVPASSVSEGTLVTLAILTLLHSKPQPRLVLLDNLGMELHPTAQGDLVRLLQRIQETNPKLQIVATTHSPYILDGVEPRSVRVFARAKDGTARVCSLADHPDGTRTDLTAGQIWTLDPEQQWVLADGDR